MPEEQSLLPALRPPRLDEIKLLHHIKLAVWEHA
jgi:hypothetical protein